MRALRTMPALMLTAGLGIGAMPALALVKATVAQFELSQVARLLHMDWLTHCDPPPATQDAFSAYLREALDVKTERDVALDHWGRPYGIEYMGAERVRLYSMGLNGVKDGCAPFRASAAIEQWVGSFVEHHADDDGTASLLDEPLPGAGSDAEPDDICVGFDMPACQVEPTSMLAPAGSAQWLACRAITFDGQSASR